MLKDKGYIYLEHLQGYLVVAKSTTVQIYTAQICTFIQSTFTIKKHACIVSSSTTQNYQIIFFCFLFGMQFITDMIFSASSATKIRMHQMQMADSKLRPTGNTTLSCNAHWSHGPAFSIVDSHKCVNHMEKLCGRIFSLWLLNTKASHLAWKFPGQQITWG